MWEVPGSNPGLGRVFFLLQGRHVLLSFVGFLLNYSEGLEWWHEFLPQWNGVGMLPEPSPAKALRLWTDASGSKGLGGYFLRPDQTVSDLTKEACFSIRIASCH
jgi:hypothetical protein